MNNRLGSIKRRASECQDCPNPDHNAAAKDCLWLVARLEAAEAVITGYMEDEQTARSRSLLLEIDAWQQAREAK